MTMRPDVDARRAGSLPFVITWLVMLALAGVSAWTAFLGLGIWAPMIQFSIAAIQAALMYVFFMRLKAGASLMWLFAVSGFFWLLFLYGLSMTDYATRKGWPPAYTPSPQASQVDQSGP